MIVIDGKKFAEEIIDSLKKEREKIKEKIIFGAVMVGSDPSSFSFLKKKKEVASKLNIDFRIYQFKKEIKTKELRQEISRICRIPYMRSVIVQLPLPTHINYPVVLNAILEEKDPDLLNERNLGRFYNNRSFILPPVVKAIDFLLKKYKIKLFNKKIVIIGGGFLTGKPLSIYFLNQKLSFTLLEKNFSFQKEFLKEADIIFSAAGKPNLIEGKMLKKGVTVFDLSYNILKGKLVGDCQKETVLKKARIYSPVPNGIGPLTVAFLFSNVIFLTKKVLNLK
ncbi:MAG: tetrahydrofolate dehydrogenase/cyclohydrolase catalytic domain-containing protein [Candidatus Paceibacterota bacterium]